MIGPIHFGTNRDVTIFLLWSRAQAFLQGDRFTWYYFTSSPGTSGGWFFGYDCNIFSEIDIIANQIIFFTALIINQPVAFQIPMLFFTYRTDLRIIDTITIYLILTIPIWSSRHEVVNIHKLMSPKKLRARSFSEHWPLFPRDD